MGARFTESTKHEHMNLYALPGVPMKCFVKNGQIQDFGAGGRPICIKNLIKNAIFTLKKHEHMNLHVLTSKASGLKMHFCLLTGWILCTWTFVLHREVHKKEFVKVSAGLIDYFSKIVSENYGDAPAFWVRFLQNI